MTRDRLVRALGLASLIPVLGFPLSNPDLFWHLSAARRIRETGAIPAADWLSSTRAGAPWADFEWVSQLVFGALHRLGGMPALWCFKAALMAASAYLVLKTIELYGGSAYDAAAALSLWGAASLTRSDIRPELFSLIGFGLVLLALERRRLGRRIPGPGAFVALFCVWGNLHPGFVYGLALTGLYAAGETAENKPEAKSLWLYLAAGVLGALLQPYVLANAEVLWRHWKDMGNIGVRISEWRGIRLDDPWFWPFWIALLCGCGSALLLLRRGRRPPLGPLASLLFFGFTASRHSRMAGYSVACSVPLAVAFLRAASEPARNRLKAACLVVFACYSLASSLQYGFGRKIFNDHFIPRAAAEFLAGQARELPRRGLYNPWGWGGYLGWRLYPDYLVFQDGRYLFHDLLEETGDALSDPQSWQDFLARRRIDLALMENAPLLIDGRPYHLSYMPRTEWALVYRDEKALIFARRASVPAAWIKAREEL